MGIVIDQSIRNSIVSYFGIIIGFVSTIYLFPNILEADQFGLTRTMIAIMSIGGQLICLGIPGTIIKYYPFLSSATKNPKGLFNAFLIPVLFAFVIFVLVFLAFKDYVLQFYSDTSLMPQFYFFFIPLVLFYALFEILKRYVNIQLDTVFVSFTEEILLRLIVITNLILYYFDIISFTTFVIIFVINYGFQIIVLGFYALKNKYLNFSISTDFINKELIKKISTFSFFSFLGGVTIIIVGNIDMVMISSMIGLSETGIYSVAFYIGSVIAIPSRSISKISLPLISFAFEKGNTDEIKKIYKQTSVNQYLFGFLIFIGVWANLENLYKMVPDEYAAGSLVILIIGFANLINMITGSCSQIVICSPYYKFGLYFSILLVILTILLNLLLIPLYGILGAATATATAIFLTNVSKVIFVWIKLKMQPISIKSLYLTILGGIILGITFLIPSLENFYLDILFRSFFIATIYLGLVWLLKLSDEFNQAVNEIFQKYFR